MAPLEGFDTEAAVRSVVLEAEAVTASTAYRKGAGEGKDEDGKMEAGGVRRHHRDSLAVASAWLAIALTGGLSISGNQGP